MREGFLSSSESHMMSRTQPGEEGEKAQSLQGGQRVQGPRDERETGSGSWE